MISQTELLAMDGSFEYDSPLANEKDGLVIKAYNGGRGNNKESEEIEK